VALEWKPPHGAWSVLDDRHLTTALAGRTFVLETPFPADDRSLGYERGSSITRSWQAAVMNAAAEAAAEVVNRLPLLAGVSDKDPAREERVRDFVGSLARVAFRRPLRSEEDRLYREGLFAGAANLEAAVRRAVLLIFMSPSFLYTDLTPAGETPSQHAVASRLALALWDSIPDSALQEAAGLGNCRHPAKSKRRRAA
jgi:hypothetical protein